MQARATDPFTTEDAGSRLRHLSSAMFDAGDPQIRGPKFC